MKKIITLLVPIFIFLGGYASASYYVEVAPANPSTAVWFQFDSNGNNAFDAGDDKTDWNDAWQKYLTYGHVSKLSLDFYDTQGGSYLFSTTGYCVDLKTGAGDDVADFQGLTGNQKKAAWLMDYSLTSPNHADTPTDNVALQLAIWGVLYGDGFNVLDGLNGNGSPGSDEIFALYSDYMNAVNSNEYTGDGYQILNFNNTQDMIVKTVPIPPAILLLGLGMVGITSVKRTGMVKV